MTPSIWEGWKKSPKVGTPDSVYKRLIRENQRNGCIRKGEEENRVKHMMMLALSCREGGLR
jgi:hypothetical protein